MRGCECVCAARCVKLRWRSGRQCRQNRQTFIFSLHNNNKNNYKITWNKEKHGRKTSTLYTFQNSCGAQKQTSPFSPITLTIRYAGYNIRAFKLAYQVRTQNGQLIRVISNIHYCLNLLTPTRPQFIPQCVKINTHHSVFILLVGVILSRIHYPITSENPPTHTLHKRATVEACFSLSTAIRWLPHRTETLTGYVFDLCVFLYILKEWF